MLQPPRTYRMITPQVTISGPLTPASIDFVKQTGCRKIVTIGGGFLHPDVVPHIKENQMEVVYYPFPVCSEVNEVQESLSRVHNQIQHLIKKGSRVHVVGDVSLTDIACIVGALRKTQGWSLGNIWSEAIDISDGVETSDLITAIHNFEPNPQSNPFSTENN